MDLPKVINWIFVENEEKIKYMTKENNKVILSLEHCLVIIIFTVIPTISTVDGY